MGNRWNRVKKFVARHRRVWMPLLLLLAVTVTVGISLAARRHTDRVKAETQVTSQEAANSEEVLEENAYPEVNDLFARYYQAMTDGDTDTIAAMSAELSDEEKIRIREISKYIDSYPSIDVYTKPGPVDGSYVCYVVTTMKFKDHDWEIPGLQTMYVCTNDSGDLYINNAQEQDKSVSDYIQTVSLQDKVVDLNNKVTSEYNKMVADDADLSAYLNELSSNIDVSVGQALAQLQKENEASGEDTEAESTDADESDRAQLQANDVVNVRKSASEDGDILGTTTEGEQYALVSEDESTGWSEIVFNGQNGYVKSEYFTKIDAGDEAADTADSSDTADSADTEAAADTETAAEASADAAD